MPKIKKLYFKDINTLRFLAYLPIFFFVTLYFLRTKNDGAINLLSDLFLSLSINSLDVYFFISSFLITSLALREYKYHHKFALKKFYFRKLLRILPLLFIALFFVLFFHSYIFNVLKLTPILPSEKLYYFFGIPNFVYDIKEERYTYTVIIYTIYMFLQFYLVWGLILKFLNKQILLVSYVCIAIGVITRLIYVNESLIYYFNPLSFGVSIGFGGIIAYTVREKESVIEFIKKISKTQLVLLYFIGILMVLSLYILTKNNLTEAFIPLLTVSFYSFVILEQTFCKKSLIKLRKFKFFNRLGKISFGLILLTPVVATLLSIAFESIDKGLESNLFKIIFILSTFVVTWFVTDVSYNSYEKIFRYIKRDLKKV